MPDIEIKRGYEVLPDNNIRFGIRVINNSEFIISDVEVILDYNESLFDLQGNKIQKLGTIPPTVPRTAKFILKPLGCIHKENIGATIIYKDHQWKKHTEEMRPKEVHCVCPFLKEKSIKRADFLSMSKSGFFEERGVNFEGISVEKLVEFISHTCKNRLYRVDEFSIENGKIIYLAGDAIGEKAYYLLTAVVKEYEGLAQVLLRANSDKKFGLNGFLNEILDNLRHLVISASAREIGIIKKEQVINIIDSVVQRSSFSVSDGAPSVNVRDSIVQRAEIKADEERKKNEEEQLRKEREEQERKEYEEKAQREKERLRKAKEIEERGRKAIEERDRQRKAEAENRERELKKQRAEEERQRRQNEEIGGIHREKEEERLRLEKDAKSSGGKLFYVVIIIFGVLALGWYGTQDSNSPAISAPQKTAPSVTATPTPIMTAKATPSASTPQKTATSIAQNGLVAEYQFDSDAKDSSRNGNDGTINGASFVEGVHGKALSFNGVNNYVEKISASGVPQGSDPITITFWAKPANTDKDEYFVMIGRCDQDGMYTVAHYHSSSMVEFAFCGNDLFPRSPVLTLNEWNYITATYDGKTRRIYINGKEIASDTPVAPKIKIPNIYIGKSPQFAELSYTGIMDEVRIYNRALSSEEIKQLYAESKP